MNSAAVHHVSAIVPVYNGERYLADAVRSILAQGYHPLDVVVVDDGSTDASVSIAEGFGPSVRVYAQEHAGAAAARNTGVDKAKGDFLAFLDADDLWAEQKLSRQVQALCQDDTLDMVFGHVSQFYDPNLPDAQKKGPLAHEVMPGYVPGAMLIRRESFARIGPFAADWRVGEFMDWYLRAQDKGLRALMLPDVVLLRRIHETNLGIRERNSREDYVRILKAALDRRRKMGSGNGEAAP